MIELLVLRSQFDQAVVDFGYLEGGTEFAKLIKSDLRKGLRLVYEILSFLC